MTSLRRVLLMYVIRLVTEIIDDTVILNDIGGGGYIEVKDGEVTLL